MGMVGVGVGDGVGDGDGDGDGVGDGWQGWLAQPCSLVSFTAGQASPATPTCYPSRLSTPPPPSSPSWTSYWPSRRISRAFCRGDQE